MVARLPHRDPPRPQRARSYGRIRASAGTTASRRGHAIVTLSGRRFPIGNADARALCRSCRPGRAAPSPAGSGRPGRRRKRPTPAVVVVDQHRQDLDGCAGIPAAIRQRALITGSHWRGSRRELRHRRAWDIFGAQRVICGRWRCINPGLRDLVGRLRPARLYTFRMAVSFAGLHQVLISYRRHRTHHWMIFD